MKNNMSKLLLVASCLFFSMCIFGCVCAAAVERSNGSDLTSMYKLMAKDPQNSFGVGKQASELVKFFKVRPDQNKKTVLHYAIENRDPEAVRLLLKLEFDPNLPAEFKPLYSAIWLRTRAKSEIEIRAENQMISDLLRSGAIVDSDCLAESVESGLAGLTRYLLLNESARLLLKKRARPLFNPSNRSSYTDFLHIAITRGDQRHVELLLDAGMQIESQHIVTSVCRGFHEITRFLLKKFPLEKINKFDFLEESCPLYVATKKNDIDHVAMLLEAGAIVDSRILRLSVSLGRHSLTRQLLSVRPYQESLNAALEVAARNEDIEHMQMLIAAGANHTNNRAVWVSVIYYNKMASVNFLLHLNAPESDLMCEGVAVDAFAKRQNRAIYTLIQNRRLADQFARKNQRALIECTYMRDEAGRPVPKYPREVIRYIAQYIPSPARQWQDFINQPEQNRRQLIAVYERSLRLSGFQKLKFHWGNFWSKLSTLRKLTPCGFMHWIGIRLHPFCFW